MSKFEHVLWGYGLTYPDDWIRITVGDVENLAAIPEALEPDYIGPKSGQIMVRGEWNSSRQPIEPIWNRHIGMLASWLGAKQVGSAPWKLAGAAGLEAEIVMPKKDDRRLWTGILEHNWTVLHFVVLHLKEEYEYFQTLATEIISSLHFPNPVEGVLTSPDGLPLPPNYELVPADDILNDIRSPADWRAYDGQSSIEALQAFYLREAPNFGWLIKEYVPFPGSADLGFARIMMEKDEQQVVLGILPYQDEGIENSHPARLVFKLR